MEEHLDELATIETLDSGAVYTLALKTHIGMSIDTFRYFAGFCDKIHVSLIFMACILAAKLSLSFRIWLRLFKGKNYSYQ